VAPATSVLTPFFWRRRLGRENTGGPSAKTVGVLVDGRLQFGKNLPGFVRVFRGHRFSTKFSNSIIKATSPRLHKQQNPMNA